MGLGAPELLIIGGLIVLLFGAAKLPKLARSLGQAKNEFEAGAREGAKAEGESGDTDTAADAKPAKPSKKG